MIIDSIFAILMVMAIFKGYRRGFIIAVFSVLALLTGLAAAIKLSAVVAVYLKGSVNVSVKWLPAISFVLVFMAAVFLVRLGAAAIEKTVQFAMLGWVNRIGGMVLYALLYTIIVSVLLFYADKIHLLTPEAITASVTYNYIQPWGPKALAALGSVLPFFSNMFHDLESFFGKLATQAK